MLIKERDKNTHTHTHTHTHSVSLSFSLSPPCDDTARRWPSANLETGLIRN